MKTYDPRSGYILDVNGSKIVKAKEVKYILNMYSVEGTDGLMYDCLGEVGTIIAETVVLFKGEYTLIVCKNIIAVDLKCETLLTEECTIGNLTLTGADSKITKGGILGSVIGDIKLVNVKIRNKS